MGKAMNCLGVELSKTPGRNPLFTAFLEGAPEVQGYFRRMPSNLSDRLSHCRSVSEQERYPRRPLVEAIARFHRQLGFEAQAVPSLEVMARSDAVAVLTGQQVGIAGGPAYGLYKAAAAVSLAERLKQQGIPAVPVFWLAADDSDYEEVAKTSFPGADGELRTLVHPYDSVSPAQMAGTVSVAVWERWLGQDDTGWRQLIPARWLRLIVSEAYRPGRTLAEAFACWLLRLFGGRGLLCFHPLSVAPDEIYSSFFRVAVEKRADLVEAVLLRNRELKAKGLPVQVRVESSETFLFLIEGNRRWKLEWREDRYVAKGRRSFHCSPLELLRAVDEGSVRLGPSVLLRPLWQEFLFPAACAVLGPAEVAYFAQLEALGRFWNLRPVAAARPSITVVDRRSARLLDRYGLSVPDLWWNERDRLLDRVLRGSGWGKVLGRLDNMDEMIRRSMEEIGREAGQIDPVAAQMVTRAAPRLRYHLERIRRRILHHEREKGSAAARHLDLLASRLAPERMLQERVVNANWILAEGGPALLDHLIEWYDPDDRYHFICRVEG